MDFTLLTFQGRLTDDPQLKTSESGVSICKFSVACNKRLSKEEERTSFIPTTVFGRQAEICHEYLSKGREVRVVGELETDTYTDKEGNTRKGFGCVAQQVVFGAGGSKENEEPEKETTVSKAKARYQETVSKSRKPFARRR